MTLQGSETLCFKASKTEQIKGDMGLISQHLDEESVHALLIYSLSQVSDDIKAYFIVFP